MLTPRSRISKPFPCPGNLTGNVEFRLPAASRLTVLYALWLCEKRFSVEQIQVHAKSQRTERRKTPKNSTPHSGRRRLKSTLLTSLNRDRTGEVCEFAAG